MTTLVIFNIFSVACPMIGVRCMQTYPIFARKKIILDRYLILNSKF